ATGHGFTDHVWESFAESRWQGRDIKGIISRHHIGDFSRPYDPVCESERLRECQELGAMGGGAVSDADEPSSRNLRSEARGRGEKTGVVLHRIKTRDATDDKGFIGDAPRAALLAAAIRVGPHQGSVDAVGDDGD